MEYSFLTSTANRGSSGASEDHLNPYSTTTRVTHKNWLPTLHKKFHLHINSKPVNYGEKNGMIPRIPQSTGFTKNTTPFVEYDKIVDEKEIK
jgi:hypothetical protein